MVYIFSISHRKVHDSLHAGNQRLQAILPRQKSSYTAISETEKKSFSSFLSFFSLFENRVPHIPRFSRESDLPNPFSNPREAA